MPLFEENIGSVQAWAGGAGAVAVLGALLAIIGSVGQNTSLVYDVSNWVLLFAGVALIYLGYQLPKMIEERNPFPMQVLKGLLGLRIASTIARLAFGAPTAPTLIAGAAGVAVLLYLISNLRRFVEEQEAEDLMAGRQ